MHQIAYFSCANHILDPEELSQILDESRSWNADHGLTGLLLYRDGNFLQVLEGEEADVREIFTKISRDPRHKNIIVVLDEEVEERFFPEWEMAFRDVSGSDAQGYISVLKHNWQDYTQPPEGSRCRVILDSFRRSFRE